ncbi:DUF2268 domain-containing putative Zn-dependent protease [Fusibacter bizertensis]
MIHIDKKIKIGTIIALIFILTLLLVIKFNDEGKMESDQPKFKTIVLKDQFTKYIENTKNTNNDKLYKEIIFDSIYENYFQGSEYSQLAVSYINRTINDIDDLNKKLELLNNAHIEELIDIALQKCNKYLQGVDTTVLIFPSTLEYQDLTLNLGGVSGCTIGSGKILILVDPTINDWESKLLYTVAHEYHHSVWTSKKLSNENFTLLDYLIFEGKADSFANIVYPEIEVPWTSSVNHEVEITTWNAISDYLSNTDSELLLKVMFGGVDNYPYWGGYTIGYKIVQEFIKNNQEINIEEWTKLQPNILLEKSNYDYTLK